MGARGPRAHAGASRLEHDHRFLFRDPFRDFGEGAAVLQVLEVLADDLGVVILLEECQQVVLVDIGLVAEADDGGDAHLGRAREADDRHADAAGLRRERGAALDVIRGAERRAQVLGRVVEAVDVGTHEADVVLAGNGYHFFLAGHVTGLGKAGRDQHRTGNFLFAYLDERLGDKLRRDREHRDVDDTRHVLDTLVGLLAEDRIGTRVDRIDRALVAAVDQILHDRIADLAVLRRSADDRHGVGLHDAVHLPDDDLLARPVARHWRLEVQHHAHVSRGGALGRRKHGIQIEFGNLGEVRHQLRDIHDHGRERLAVHGLRAAHPAQYFRGRDAIEHRQCVLAARRGETEGDVLEDLDQNAAEPEGHQLAECRIGHGADEYFLAAAEHLLDLHAVDRCLGVIAAGIGDDTREGFLRGLRAPDANHDAAGLGFVQDLW